MTTRRKIPILERWRRDRNRTMTLLGGLPNLVKTAPEWDIDRVRWDIEEWEMYLGWAKTALREREGAGPLREKIANLRNMTEANGCTPSEARTATALADRLERRAGDDEESK